MIDATTLNQRLNSLSIYLQAALQNRTEEDDLSDMSWLGDGIEALRFARRMVQNMNKWLPIEAAPKDGTRILICLEKSIYARDPVQIASWLQHPLLSAEGFWCPKGLPSLEAIVGWMPLPEPPGRSGE